MTVNPPRVRILGSHFASIIRREVNGDGVTADQRGTHGSAVASLSYSRPTLAQSSFRVDNISVANIANRRSEPYSSA